MHKVFILATICIVAIGGVTLFMGRDGETEAVDPENLTPEQQRYCEKVEQWNREEMLDVEPKWRWGHPDDKGTYAKWCSES